MDTSMNSSGFWSQCSVISRDAVIWNSFGQHLLDVCRHVEIRLTDMLDPRFWFISLLRQSCEQSDLTRQLFVLI